MYFEDTYSAEEINAALKDVVIEVKTEIIDDGGGTGGGGSSTDTEDDDTVYEEPNFNYVIIKTKDSTVAKRGSLYEATRYKWLAGNKITQYSFVISVIDTIVKEVYIVDKWEKNDGRWEFFGKEASGEAYQKLIGKRIPKKYRKKGMASPVVYKKI